MTPQFAKAIDPIFLYALGLLDRIEKEESPSPSEEQVHILALIDRAEAALGRSPEWELAKYALVSWIDELLGDAKWEGHDWWNNNVLEVKLFNSRLCNELFYTKAQEAGALPKRDALEVFYVCAVLGFRGLYRDPQVAAILGEARGLPPDLETWAKQTALSIRLGQGLPPIHDSGAAGAGAPPMSGQSVMITSLLIGVVLAAFTVIVGLLVFVGGSV
jgi:type VI secretion system protein ImpK